MIDARPLRMALTAAAVFFCVLLARPAAAAPQNRPPDPAPRVPADLDLGNRASVDSALASSKAALERMAEGDPLRTSFSIRVDVLGRQLALLDAIERDKDLAAGASDAALAETKAKSDDAARKLANLDANAALADLAIASAEVVRAAVDEKLEGPLARAKTEFEEADGSAKSWAAELAGIEREIADSERERAEHAARLAEIEAAIGAGGTATESERDALRKRAEIRSIALSHLARRKEYLAARRPLVERLAEITRLERAAAADRLSAATRLRDAGAALLKERLAEESRAARERVEEKKAEVERTGSEHERIFAVEELENGRLEAAQKTLEQEAAAIAESRVQLAAALDAASKKLALLREVYGGGAGAELPPSGEEVAATIRRLEDEHDRSAHLKAQDENAKLRRRLEAEREVAQLRLDRLGGTIAERAAQARAAFEVAGAAVTPELAAADWREEALRWNGLEARRRGLLEKTAATLDRVIADLLETQRARRNLFDVGKETIFLLRSKNLFLRGENLITWDAISQGIADLPRLPGAIVTTVRGAVAYLFEPDRVRAVVGWLLASGFVALGLLATRRRLGARAARLIESDLTTLAARTAVTMAFLARAVCFASVLFLVPYLATVMLPDLSEGVSELLFRLGIAFGAFWLGQRLLTEIFRPMPPERAAIRLDARSALVAFGGLSALLYVSLAFVSVNFALSYLGYRNAGVLALSWATYKIVVVVVLTLLLLRRSLLLALLPSEEKAVGRFLHFLVRWLHPLIVLLVPAVLVVDLFRFDILSGLIAGISALVVTIALGSFLLFHGASYLIERWLASPHHDDEDEIEERRRGAIAKLLRFGLKLAVFVIVVTVFLMAQGATLKDLRLFLDIPLPLQGVDVDDKVTWWDLVFAAIVFALFLYGSRYLKIALRDVVFPRSNVDSGLQYTVTTIAGYVLVIIGAYLALTQVFDLGRLGYIVAALTVGIGFGLQEIISNFVSGLILLFERPLKVGDIVKVGETEGVVQKISIRATTVQTFDNISMLIPNKAFVTENVVNYVYGDPKIRLRVPVGVAYGSDTALVRKVLLDVANDHGQVLERPAPDVFFMDFGESSLDFVLAFWISEPFNRWRIASSIRFAIDAAFRRNGITIPFPQRDLHVVSARAALRVVSEERAAHDGEEKSNDVQEEEEPARAPKKGPEPRLP